jgi:hypothetical protein
MELYCTPKVNTLQLNTVGNFSNTRTRPTRMVSEHSFLYNSSNRTSCGNIPTLTPTSKHVGTIRRRAIGPLAHHNGTSAYSTSLTCHLPAPTIEWLHRPLYKLTCSSRQSVALRITYNLHSFSDHTDFIRSSVSIEIHKHPTRNLRHACSLLWAPQCCLFTLLPPSIVVYLRKRNVVLCHCYNSANVIKPREPHTCNNMLSVHQTYYVGCNNICPFYSVGVPCFVCIHVQNNNNLKEMTILNYNFVAFCLSVVELVWTSAWHVQNFFLGTVIFQSWLVLQNAGVLEVKG